jgi:hypothetical protein
LDDFANVVKKA